MSSAKVEDPQLSGWVKNQCKHREKGTLLPEQKAKLDSIGLVWQYATKRKRASMFSDSGEREDDSMVQTEHRAVHSTGLDDDEHKDSEDYGNGLEEGDGSESEEFEG
jgi:hypothetical protein